MEINDHHILLYLENRLSKEESDVFEQQMCTSKTFRKEVEDVRFVWNMSNKLKAQRQVDMGSNWKKLSTKIAFERKKQAFIHSFRSVAAILILPLLLSTTLLYLASRTKNELPVEQVEIDTAYGLVSKITLSDGSTVWLNSGSRLSYPREFKGDKREVRLNGEAYFKVSADPEHRFVVMTPDEVAISAYGTEFNVKAYSDDPTIEATLAEGHIEIQKKQVSLPEKLNPGEYITYDKLSGTTSISKGNLTAKMGWKDGKMVFRRASMKEITTRLSRRFNVDIRLEGDELQDYEYSATFTTESLEDILRLLEKSAPIRCEVIYPEQTQDLSYTRRIVTIRTGI